MEYRTNAPVRGEWDVLVCGAGPAGIAAAVSAARMGMRVMVLERYGAVGGCLTLGNVTTVMGAVAPGTIRDEIAALLRSPDSSTGIDNEQAKGLLVDLLRREGVEFRLQTSVLDALVEDGVIHGVFAQTQAGLACYRAQRVVDATGDGYVSAMAGAQAMV